MNEEKHKVVLLNENELYDWGCRYSYKIPRRSFAVECLNGLEFNQFAKIKVKGISERKEDWLLAEYAATHSVQNVPFYQIKRLYGFSETHAQILRSRYAEFGLDVVVTNGVVSGAFDKWWCDQRMSLVIDDVKSGMVALPEMFDLKTHSNSKKIKQIAKALNEIDANRCVGGSDFYRSLFDYSRSHSIFATGVLAAMCDLGILLRSQKDDADWQKTVDKFSVYVRERIGLDEEKTMPILCEMGKEFKGISEISVENVLFLKWKYDSEVNGGSVDFGTMHNDVAILQPILKDRTITSALSLFGGYVGFKALAMNYHSWKRGMDRQSKVIRSLCVEI